MNQSQRNDDSPFVIQDGVRCPAMSPWSTQVSKVTGLPLFPVIGLAGYILYVHSLVLLAVWLVLLVISAWPLRYLVCARCPYYGQSCSTSNGLLVQKMFAKQEGKSMKLGLWLDLGFLIALFVIPIWPAWISSGWPLLIAWIAAYMLWMGILSRMGCTACPFAFCPIGKIGRTFWKLLGVKC